MYSTCIHCHAALGANQQVEAFPVGHRLAFDEARGRLWAVCASCGRWNLSPLEERWEAIEQCERIFRGTTRRVSTENVGLARLPSGLDLVRVGSPLRPEFAAWRYGSELVRRRGRDIRGAFGAAGVALGYGAGSLAVGVGGIFVVGAAGALAFPAGAALYLRHVIGASHREEARVVAMPDRVGHRVRVKHLRTLEFVGIDDAGVRLRVGSDAGPLEVEGQPALRIAAAALARRNQVGGTRRIVQEAVQRVEGVGGPEGVLRNVAGALSRIRYVDRLALEIALHEEEERRAMEGELTALERSWQEAEEIAAIADSLLLPSAVETILRRLRGTGEGAG